MKLPFQTSLRNLFWVVLLTAVALGWLAEHRAVSRAHEKLAEKHLKLMQYVHQLEHQDPCPDQFVDFPDAVGITSEYARHFERYQTWPHPDTYRPKTWEFKQSWTNHINKNLRIDRYSTGRFSLEVHLWNNGRIEIQRTGID